MLPEILDSKFIRGLLERAGSSPKTGIKMNFSVSALSANCVSTCGIDQVNTSAPSVAWRCTKRETINTAVPGSARHLCMMNEETASRRHLKKSYPVSNSSALPAPFGKNKRVLYKNLKHTIQTRRHLLPHQPLPRRIKVAHASQTVTV